MKTARELTYLLEEKNILDINKKNYFGRSYCNNSSRTRVSVPIIPELHQQVFTVST